MASTGGLTREDQLKAVGEVYRTFLARVKEGYDSCKPDAQILEKLAKDYPSGFASLAAAKAAVLVAKTYAVEHLPAKKEEENRVLGLLHTAASLAMAGAQQHDSMECLLLATYVLNSCRGKRVDRENRDAMLRKLAQILKAHGPVDLLDEYRTLLSKPRTMTKAWADPGAERLGVDRWPFEFDPNAQSSEEYLETALKTAQERLLFIDSDELVLKFVSMCPMPEKKSEFTANYRKSIKRVNELDELPMLDRFTYSMNYEWMRRSDVDDVLRHKKRSSATSKTAVSREMKADKDLQAGKGSGAERTKPLRPQARREEAAKRQQIIREYIMMNVKKSAEPGEEDAAALVSKATAIGLQPCTAAFVELAEKRDPKAHVMQEALSKVAGGDPRLWYCRYPLTGVEPDMFTTNLDQFEAEVMNDLIDQAPGAFKEALARCNLHDIFEFTQEVDTGRFPIRNVEAHLPDAADLNSSISGETDARHSQASGTGSVDSSVAGPEHDANEREDTSMSAAELDVGSTGALGSQASFMDVLDKLCGSTSNDESLEKEVQELEALALSSPGIDRAQDAPGVNDPSNLEQAEFSDDFIRKMLDGMDGRPDKVTVGGLDNSGLSPDDDEQSNIWQALDSRLRCQFNLRVQLEYIWPPSGHPIRAGVPADYMQMPQMESAYAYLGRVLRPAVRGLLFLQIALLSGSPGSHPELSSMAQSLESPSASLEILLDGCQLTAASGRWAVGDMVQKLVQNPSYKDEGPLQIYIDFMCKLFGMVPDKAWSKVIMTGGLKTEAIDRINRRARLAGSIHKLLLDCMVTFPQYMHDSSIRKDELLEDAFSAVLLKRVQRGLRLSEDEATAGRPVQGDCEESLAGLDPALPPGNSQGKGCPSKKLKDDSSSEILSTVAEHFDELLKLFAFMCFQYGFGFRDAADLSSAIRAQVQPSQPSCEVVPRQGIESPRTLGDQAPMLQRSIQITRHAVHQRATTNLEMISQETPSDLSVEDYARGLESWTSDDTLSLETRIASLEAFVSGPRYRSASTEELVTPIHDAIQQITAARKLLVFKPARTLEAAHGSLHYTLERWDNYFAALETSDGEVSLPADWDLAANKFIRDMVAALSQMVDNVYNHSKASVLLAFIGTTFHEAALLRRIEVANHRAQQLMPGAQQRARKVKHIDELRKLKDQIQELGASVHGIQARKMHLVTRIRELPSEWAKRPEHDYNWLCLYQDFQAELMRMKEKTISPELHDCVRLFNEMFDLVTDVKSSPHACYTTFSAQLGDIRLLDSMLDLHAKFLVAEVCNQAAVWPADVLADELVRTTLPSAWEPLVLKEQTARSEAARLELLAELEAEEEKVASASKKKKKKAKKGAAAASVATSAVAAAAAAEQALQGEGDDSEGSVPEQQKGTEDLQGAMTDEQQEGFERMLAEMQPGQPTEDTRRREDKTLAPGSVLSGEDLSDDGLDMLAQTFARRADQKGKTTGPAPPAPPKAAKAKEARTGPPVKRPAAQVARIVSWEGDWMCSCGVQNWVYCDCEGCKQQSPCRDWIRGICNFGRGCKYPHPVFDLPPDGPPSDRPADRLAVNLWPGAPMYKRAPAASGGPKPTVRGTGARGAPRPAISTGAGPSADVFDVDSMTPEELQQQELLLAQFGHREEHSQAEEWAGLAPASPLRPPPPPSPQAAQHGASETMRIVSWMGHWICSCGERVSPLRAGGREGSGARRRCPACGQIPPCRKWMLGECPQDVVCPSPHPPFSLGEDTHPEPTPNAHVRRWDGQPIYMPPRPLAPRISSVSVGGPAGLGFGGLGISAAHSWDEPDPIGSIGAGLSPPLAAPSDLYSNTAQLQPTAVEDAAITDDVEDDLSSMLASMGVSVAPEQPGWRSALMTGQEVPSQAAPATGLTNAAGEYNCFLNVIVQCLWHCGDFRQQVLSWPSRFAIHSPVVSTLARLFQALDQEEKEPGTGHVSPNELRKALSALPGELFRVGEMNDAGEVLLKIYDCIKGESREAQHAVDSIFGLPVHEYVYCDVCNQTTQESRYVQYFFNTSAAGMRSARQLRRSASVGQLLRSTESQDRKSCDTDKGGCDRRFVPLHVLEQPPRVFTLQLTWQSSREPPSSIADTMACLEERVDLSEVYCEVYRLAPGLSTCSYRLHSLVCYYGKHYSAFVWMALLGCWVMFDDVHISRIGSWPDVVRKCELGRIQPSVLFYVAES